MTKDIFDWLVRADIDPKLGGVAVSCPNCLLPIISREAVELGVLPENNCRCEGQEPISMRQLLAAHGLESIIDQFEPNYLDPRTHGV